MFNLYAGADDPGFLANINVYLACQQVMPESLVHANDFVNHSVAKTREILHRYHIGCQVVSKGIIPVSFAGPLVRGADEKDPNITNTVANEVRQQIDQKRRRAGGQPEVTDAVVVIFGVMDHRLLGAAIETGHEPTARYPYWYATVNLSLVSLTTMLHEILHCANAQHYMARRDLLDEKSEDPFDIMVVPKTDAQRNMRKSIGLESRARLKRAYFYQQGFTPRQTQSVPNAW